MSADQEQIADIAVIARDRRDRKSKNLTTDQDCGGILPRIHADDRGSGTKPLKHGGAEEDEE